MNRFVKDNMVLFIVMGCTILGAIVLLTFAVLGHARMYQAHAEATELRDKIADLIKQKPAPVGGNEEPMKAEAEFFKAKTAELLPHFGQIKGPALDAFIKELGVEKQKFLETFRAAWEADDDRKAQGGRQRFYRRFSRGQMPEHNWHAELKIKPAEIRTRWQKGVDAFRKEYQKLTVEPVDERNQDELLMSVLGVPRNFEGRPELCMQNFMVPMARQMQELCARPPLLPGEKEQAERDDGKKDENAPPSRVELLGEAGSFGFNYKSNPKPDEIIDIVKNWEVIGDLGYRIIKERIYSLNSFVIRNLAGEKVGRYVIYHYTFSVTGDIARIRNLVKALNDAAKENRMYIVRSIYLYADRDGAQEIFLERQQEAMAQRSELDAAGTDENKQPGQDAAAPTPDMDYHHPGMDGDMHGEKPAQRVKTPEQIRAEELKKPYDKRTGYGRLLFGGSKNCEAVFDVEYVYLAEPELE